MKRQLDWADYRVVLEIARAGSLTEARRRTGISHPTLFRRLNAIEERLGTRLFERSRRGYALTAAGEDLCASAEKIETLTGETERRLARLDHRPAGQVTLTTTDALFFGLIADALKGLPAVAPDIEVEVRLSNAVLDLSRREADIAVRPSMTPDPVLVGRRLGTVRQAVYRSASLPEETGSWVGPGPAMQYKQLAHWMMAEGHDTQCAVRADTTLGMYAAVRAGAGRAVLPRYFADRDPDLVRCGPDVDGLDIDLWLLIHPDLRRTARVRAVMDYLAACSTVRERLVAVTPSTEGPSAPPGSPESGTRSRVRP